MDRVYKNNIYYLQYNMIIIINRYFAAVPVSTPNGGEEVTVGIKYTYLPIGERTMGAAVN